MHNFLDFMPLLAEDGGAAGGGAEGNDGADKGGGADGAGGAATLTLESALKDAGVKAEYDKAIETAKAEWQKEAEAAAKKAAEDAETDPAKLAQRKVEELSAKLAAKELREKVSGMVAEAKLPGSFTEFLTGADEKASKDRVESFTALYNDAVAKAAKDLMPGSTPKGGTGGSEDAFLAGFNKGRAK